MTDAPGFCSCEGLHRNAGILLPHFAEKFFFFLYRNHDAGLVPACNLIRSRDAVSDDEGSPVAASETMLR